MKLPWSHKNAHPNEAGQAAAIVALLLFFVFLPLAALTIDGSMIYLMRRDLQNVADASALAACTELAQGNTATALTAAQNTIQSNLGSWTEFASPNTGTGVTLVRGIEINLPDVRVAVQRRAPTVLTQFVGRGQTMVTAQAHCLSNAGGGLLPIAVRRDYGGQDVVAQDVGANNKYLNASIEVSQTWPSPYPPYTFTVPVPKTTPTDYTASPSNPGPSIPVLDSGANPINKNNNMKGSILLDVQNLGSGNPDFYNGATNNLQSNKDLSRHWMEMHGYSGPLPGVGAQVGVLNGNWGSNEMRKSGYQVGDIFAAIVYDGYVWDVPGYNVTLTPRSSNPNGIANTYPYPDNLAHAIVYDINIAQSGGSWAQPMNFAMRFALNNSPVPSGTVMRLENATGTFLADVTSASYTAVNVTEAGGWNGVLKIFSPTAGPSVFTQTNQYVSGLGIFATASSGLQKGDNSYYGFPPTGSATTPDFAVGSDAGSIVVSQFSQINLNLYTLGIGQSFPTNSCKSAPVMAHLLLSPTGPEDTWTNCFAAADQNAQNKKIDIATSEKQLAWGISVNTDAAPGNYTLRLTVSPPAGCPISTTHSVDLPLEITDQGAGSLAGNAQYVYIQGFASFQITLIKGGEVDAKCISPLVPTLDQVTVGMRPRLVPWN
jgi:hypothetical protein